MLQNPLILPLVSQFSLGEHYTHPPKKPQTHRYFGSPCHSSGASDTSIKQLAHSIYSDHNNWFRNQQSCNQNKRQNEIFAGDADTKTFTLPIELKYKDVRTGDTIALLEPQKTNLYKIETSTQRRTEKEYVFLIPLSSHA